MTSYDTDGAKFDSNVRRFLASDWAHADVLNETVNTIVNNEMALQKATFFVRNITIKTTDWKNKSYSISNSGITSDTAADVYVSSASKETAAECGISGETGNGLFTISCEDVPSDNIVIDAIVFRNEVVDSAS